MTDEIYMCEMISREGDALNPDPELVSEFLDSIHYPTHVVEANKMVTLEDFARRRVMLESRLTQYPPHQPKMAVHVVSQGLRD